MNLLYLSTWGLGDGLTHAVVFPDLEVLRNSEQFKRVVFVTAEREPAALFEPPFDASRILHLRLSRRSMRPALLARMLEFLRWPRQIGEICRTHAVAMILARGTPAGALVHLSQRHVAVPYLVASFEPHARYMLESGVWRRWDPRYIFQARWEQAQKQQARALLPVSEAFRRQLVAEGVPESKIVTLPSTVDAERFRFSAALRQEARAELAVPDGAPLGVYVGKFGDNYYGAEAFRIFGRFLARLPGFRMLVLTPMPSGAVHALARQAGFPADRLIVTAAPHTQVPRYLCAADVAFATIRPAPSRRFCSPVKTGEYWACGLPIVITEGVGDDSDIVSDHAAGAVVALATASVDAAVERIAELLNEDDHRARIASLAGTFRPRARIRQAFTAVGLL